ncbi:hypothetical protein ACFQI7_04630 [Paenibacillus allorhizosphaerae]|uniref:Uncharacterized protein n=1 Tax=Paenibacillus allorhizosphaerae TaxID=2849866 RepID=A0ABM8VC85_9BACL|nr:hypothetical protein [Paenibacillus allorhizosphaerae]CAG7623058.1 hypothetical protein PAECIP111802_00898 [Paenibacillus allorhizosphaerae]
MNKHWKTAMTAVLIGSTIIQVGTPVLAADSPQASVAAPSNYGLTDTIRAAVKSLAVESTPNGTRIAATVRLYNGGTQKTRIPDHQLRIRSTDGNEYTLNASAANKGALQPNEIGELVYMNVIDSGTPITISQLSFVYVDEYVYPKTETPLLNIPIDKQVWYASATGSQTAESKEWGESFTIPGLNSGLRYTPTAIDVQYVSTAAPSAGASAGAGTPASAAASAGAASAGAASAGASSSTGTGRVALVTVLVENPGVGRETMPDFRIDGQTEQKNYTGKRTEQGPITIDVGEKKYVHFAIPMDNNSETLKSLIVTTTETYVQAGAQGATPVSTNFDVGRLSIAVLAGGQTDTVQASPYTMGNLITMDPINKLIDGKTEVSLMEMHIHDNGDTGYKTVVGKFKLTNRNDIPVPLPAFQTELVGEGGVTYAGTRQSNAAATLNPNMGYVINYSFNVPKSETGQQLKLKLLDAQTAAPYKSTIAAIQTAATDPEAGGTAFKMYPFDITLNDWIIATMTTPTGSSLVYNYKLSLNLDIKQADDVLLDNNFSKLHFELVDNSGRIVGTADSELTGPNKLVNGKQTVTFNAKSEQLDYPLTLNVYESFDTPNGQAKRFITSLKQQNG